MEPRPQIVSIENRLPDGRGRDALDRALRSVSGITRSEHAQLVFGPASHSISRAEPAIVARRFRTCAGDDCCCRENRRISSVRLFRKRAIRCLQGVTLAGVVWAGALPVNAAVVHPVVSSGQSASDRTARASRPDGGILFNVDLDKTNLLRAPDWPILDFQSRGTPASGPAGPGTMELPCRGMDSCATRQRSQRTAALSMRIAGKRSAFRTASGIHRARSTCGLLDIMEGKDVLFQLGVNFLDENETDLSDRGQRRSREIGSSDERIASRRVGPSRIRSSGRCSRSRPSRFLANWCWASALRGKHSRSRA